MNDRRIAALVYAEWSILQRSPPLFVGLVVLPLLLAAVAIGTIGILPGMEASGENVPRALRDALPSLEPALAAQVVLADQFVLLLLLIPVALPSGFAGYAIVGEKEHRTLEPLLATPVRTEEILLAKMLAYAVPATVVTWATYAIVVIAAFFVGDPVVFAFLVRPAWPLGLFALAPVLAILSSLLGLIGSSRSADPKNAQALSSLLILPLTALWVAMIMGGVLMDLEALAIAAGAFAIVDVLVLRLAVRIFAREHILTRWK
jgi:ABC-2 type transport system permease protein